MVAVLICSRRGVAAAPADEVDQVLHPTDVRLPTTGVTDEGKLRRTVDDEIDGIPYPAGVSGGHPELRSSDIAGYGFDHVGVVQDVPVAVMAEASGQSFMSGGVGFGANEAEDFVCTAVHQTTNQLAADQAGHSGNQNVRALNQEIPLNQGCMANRGQNFILTCIAVYSNVATQGPKISRWDGDIAGFVGCQVICRLLGHV